MPSLSSRILGALARPSRSVIVDRVAPVRGCRVPALLLATAFYLSAAPAIAESGGGAVGSGQSPEVTTSVWDAPEPWRTDRFYFQTSVATVHFNPDVNHNNNQKLIYGEWRLEERWLEGQVLVGASAFSNSFGQPSQFVFGGLLWRPFDSLPAAYVKVLAGVLHGYKDEYQDKIPFNSSGFAPAIIPAVGYCFNRLCGEMVLFGTAGLMWTLGVTLP
jgi:hypothetical protein